MGFVHVRVCLIGGSSGSFGRAWVHSGAPRGRQVLSTFAWVHSSAARDHGVVVSLRRALVLLSGSVRIRVDSIRRGCRVNSG